MGMPGGGMVVFCPPGQMGQMGQMGAMPMSGMQLGGMPGAMGNSCNGGGGGELGGGGGRNASAGGTGGGMYSASNNGNPSGGGRDTGGLEGPPSGGSSAGICKEGRPNPAGEELVSTVMKEMPSYVTQDQRGFVLHSAVPARLVDHLVGSGGAVARQVMSTSGTQIAVKGGANPQSRIMSIEGQLFNICAAYMLMMRRYIEVERELRGSGGGGAAAAAAP